MFTSCSRFGLLAVLLLGGCATEVEEEETGDSESSIIGGNLDTTTRSVVLVAAGTTKASMNDRCTATVIAPRVLLTAAHCVHSDDPKEPSPTFFAVLFGPDESAKGAVFRPVARAVAHPRYVDGSEAGVDVAVLLLDRDAGVPAVRLNREALDATLVGRSVRAIGYGSDDGTTNVTGTRASVRVKVNQVAGRELSIGRVGKTTCHGDSGGPVLLSRQGRTSIVGVTSRGDHVDCAGISISTRVDTVLDFLDPFLRQERGP